MSQQYVPAVGGADSLARYLREVRRFPMLEPQEEYMLAKRWRSHGDLQAAHRLITSHLRLVVKVAASYRNCGLPIGEIISEGSIGLMKAVKRFNPDKGFRLATYAIWWIRAAVQEYVVRSWSLVKLGTTAAQRKLFFNLRKIKNRISALDGGDLSPESVDLIARELGVDKEEVVSMNRRLCGDESLNASPGSNHEDAGERQNLLTDETMNQEQALMEREEATRLQNALSSALNSLKPRDRRIFEARRLTDPPLTLAELSQECSISRERVRQIEARAFEKVRQSISAS